MRGRSALVALALSLPVVLGQLAHRSPLTDVTHGAEVQGLRLTYPLLHAILAPLTLTADWINGGSINDLRGFLIWVLLGYVLARWTVYTGGKTSRRQALRKEAVRGAWCVAAIVAFLAWVVYLPRPIPRLVAEGDEVLVLDVHSHTAVSHDGRRWFGSHQNAAWHERAGFDAAFVTDHNRCCAAAKAWRLDRSGRPPRLLDGEELSLHGLHVLALGIGTEVSNRGYSLSWDSTLAMVRYLTADGAFVVASLPEYWLHHWGEDLGALVEAGVAGFEVWTSSPRAMAFPPQRRRELLAQCRRLGLTAFGATDMHGLGRTASVWNVTRLPLWRAMDDSSLTAALLAQWRREGVDGNRVVASARFIPESRLDAAFGAPLNAWMLLRTASRRHGLALLAWIWLPALVYARRKPAG